MHSRQKSAIGCEADIRREGNKGFLSETDAVWAQYGIDSAWIWIWL
jgi:hypothetical protein